MLDNGLQNKINVLCEKKISFEFKKIDSKYLMVFDISDPLNTILNYSNQISDYYEKIFVDGHEHKYISKLYSTKYINNY